MRKFLIALTLLLASLATVPATACVGKTLIIGAVETPEGRLVAQVIAILINERTGTTVKIQNFADPDAVHRELSAGDVDIAVEYPARALVRLGRAVPADPKAAYTEAKAAYLEQLNLVWLPPLGFQAPGDHGGAAAPVAQKHTLKKFPALPRLIAKTQDLLPDATLAALVKAGDPALVAREFLREKKLI
ncbi:MAG: glycine betaine ABC transporter substrate-binding protein [Deferrisomatales bacterium]|nr:glycine betaine ABC transporter substrate-binding protein [Deferrisomatales bacterium]